MHAQHFLGEEQDFELFAQMRGFRARLLSEKPQLPAANQNFLSTSSRRGRLKLSN